VAEVFATIPSELDEIYWRCTVKDIKVKMRLYLGRHQALIVQDFQNLATIVSQAFGGKKSSADNAVKPQSADELKAAFGSVFGHG